MSSNESDVDRMIREANESHAQAERRRQEELRFLESAIDHAVGNVAQPICRGVERSLGTVTPLSKAQAPAGSRAFDVSGTSMRHDITIRLRVTVAGSPTIVDDPHAVRYTLRIEGAIMARGRQPHHFTIAEHGWNLSGQHVPSEEFIAEAINAQVAQALGIERR